MHMNYTSFIITAVIILVFFIAIYVAILRAVFRINDVVANLEKQTAYQKAIYKKVKVWMKANEIEDPDEAQKQ